MSIRLALDFNDVTALYSPRSDYILRTPSSNRSIVCIYKYMYLDTYWAHNTSLYRNSVQQPLSSLSSPSPPPSLSIHFIFLGAITIDAAAFYLFCVPHTHTVCVCVQHIDCSCCIMSRRYTNVGLYRWILESAIFYATCPCVATVKECESRTYVHRTLHTYLRIARCYCMTTFMYARKMRSEQEKKKEIERKTELNDLLFFSAFFFLSANIQWNGILFHAKYCFSTSSLCRM